MIKTIKITKQFEGDLNEGEGQEIEFKEELNDKLAKETAAFSTSNAGRIYIGVSNKAEIIGIPSINSLDNISRKDDFLKRIRGIVSKVRPRVITSVNFFKYNGKVIVAVHVYKGPKKAYYYQQKPYIRDNDESRPAEPEEIDRLYETKEINYKELGKREVNQVAIHIFGYLKYPDPYELIQIINKYEKKYNNYTGLYVHMFSKTFNVIDYPLSNEQLRYRMASYVHNKNSRYKKTVVYKKDTFKFYKDDIYKSLGNWNDCSKEESSEKLIYDIDMPLKSVFILKDNVFQYGILKLAEGNITYEDFNYFVEVTEELLKQEE